MTYLSEDSTLVAGGFVLVAGAFLIALNITQQGKHLIYAGIALGFALAVVITEWLWVTDNERIEEVVYDLRQAVLNSDTPRVLEHLAPTVQILQGDVALSEDATRELVESTLRHARFDFIRITDLQTSAGQQSRRGKAEFRALTRGDLHTTNKAIDGGTAISTWSLGFEETQPGIWQVNRISSISLPAGTLAFPGSAPSADDADLDPSMTKRAVGLARKRSIVHEPTNVRTRKHAGPPKPTLDQH